MKYPILATRGVVVFPGYRNIIEAGRPETLKAIVESMAKFEGKIVVVPQREIALEKISSIKDIYRVGTLASFTIQEEYEGGAKRLEVIGSTKVRIVSIKVNGLIMANIEEEKDLSNDKIEEKALVRKISEKLKTSFDKFGTGFGKVGDLPRQIIEKLIGIDGNGLANLIGHFLPINFEKKIKILTFKNINQKLKYILKVLKEELQIVEIERNLDTNVRKTLDKQQKEYLLRERLKAIKEELGEIASKDSEIDKWRLQVMEKKYPQEVRSKLLEEISKYEAMPPISAEANVSKNYIDWLIKLPWRTYSVDLNDIDKAQIILDKDHYGLEKVKERIIEHLAVKTNTNSKTAPIIALVGPPGVGKTSLARSIAEAVDRKFVKISLGGLRDEAEIRGHRRTYVGSMPGKIVNAINKAKTSNPVILLDEIDKMSSDYRGDPTSAMLEVLDPEQNKLFQDHYLEIEYDLSNVMFLATANYYENIPIPLMDRIEIINLSSYTQNEKIMIAQRHLIPKIIKENGLTLKMFQIDKQNLEILIQNYTLEAGVRGLKRQLDKLARKIVVKKIRKTINDSYIITEAKIKELLGKKKYVEDTKATKPIVGQVTGLAYTQYGGSTLAVEVTSFPGSGKLKITGQLKNIMNESANIALAYVKANAKTFGIDFDFQKNNIHIHVPEGAVPKDGPSAGITFATALISALSKNGVSPDLAMTGEITLQGRILAIGGLKEKSLAAVRVGIKQIFIPKANEKDLDELPKEVKEKLKIHLVSKYIQVYNNLF